MEEFSKWVWNDSFWLPQGYTWADLEPTPGINKPNFTDLYYVPLISIILMAIRFLFERFVAQPFCHYLGITGIRKIVVEDNAICERVFTSLTRHPNTEQVNGLAKQLGWSDIRVQRWFRKRRKMCEVSVLRKATESCWRCLIYLGLFLFGSYTILPTDWFWDTRDWMRGYIRNQDFNIYLKTYYLLELSFYTSLIFSQFIDIKRKDFYQMFVHHIVTILLIFTSFAIGHIRIGVVIMCLHDAGDYWLEAAKVFNYAKRQKLCDGLFVVFAVVFLITRWVYYPFWILPAMLFITVEITGPFPSYYYFATLLVILQILHIYWGALIVNMVYKFTVYGKVDRDTRSENESSEVENEVVQTNNIASKKKK
jgi:hypothetical protein